MSKDIFENPETHKIVVEDWGEVPQNERLRQCLHSFLFSICSKKVFFIIFLLLFIVICFYFGNIELIF